MAVVGLGGTPAWADDTATEMVQELATQLQSTLTPTERNALSDLVAVADPDDKHINAYAGCTDLGIPVIVVTGELIKVAISLSMADNTHQLDRYMAYAVAKIDAGEPPYFPKAWLTHDYDAEKASETFGSIMALVIGHEMGHHLLGHTGCVGHGRGDTERSVRRQLPVLNQELETAADVHAVNNLLDTALVYHLAYTAEAGTLLFQFFGKLESSSIGSSMGYFRTHPRSASRIAVLRAAAANWQLTHALPRR